MKACSRCPASAVIAITLAFLWTAGAILADSRSGAELDRVVARANVTRHPAYRALRHLEAGNAGSGRHGWLDAWTEMAPGSGLTYEVVAEGGNAYIRHQVLRDVLNHEQELVAKGQPLRASLIASNYAFDDGGANDAGLMRVLLRPLRKAAGIVAGSVLIDPADARLVQIQGRLVKNPSFWVRNVDVVWKYARLAGVVVPIELSSTAKVRMFGMSSFRMAYQYETVDGRAVTDGPQALRGAERGRH